MTKQQEKMVVENEALVYRVVHDYIGLINNSSAFSFDDLAQSGRLGLCKAVMTFDPKKNIEFSTYAYVVIRNTITRSLSSEIKRNKYAFALLADDMEQESIYDANTEKEYQRPMVVGAVDAGFSACELSDVNKIIAEFMKSAAPSIKIGITALLDANAGTSIKEIAKRYGLSDGTVKRYMFNAKKQLQKNKKLLALWEEL